jgi:hypothetical protein
VRTTEAKLAQRPIGFVAERLLLLDTLTKQEQPAVKWDQMVAALRNVPGVQATALEDWPLMSGTQHNNQISVNGEAPSQTLAFFLAVFPGWLDTMRIPLVDGRDFRDSDATPSVSMVNVTFAKTFFGGWSPVGRAFAVSSWKGPKTHYEIVGLVKDVMYRDVHEEILPQVYLPVHHAATAAGTAPGALQTMRGEVIAVRTNSDNVSQITETLRRAVTRTNPESRVSTVTAQTELGCQPDDSGAAAGNAGGVLCDGGAAAGSGGAVWSAALLGGAAGAGDRDTDCHGRRGGEYCADSECAGDCDGGGGRRRGADCGSGFGAVCVFPALWGERDGCFDVGAAGDSLASHGCVRGRSCCVASRANRSGYYATCGIIASPPLRSHVFARMSGRSCCCWDQG